MFVKGKVDFKHIEIWLWMWLSKEKLILDMSKIWLWVCFSKEKLTLDITKYDFEYNDYHIYININVWYNYNFKNFCGNDKQI
jgi:hypothetical protein